ncbi:M48 family metallopeptidase [Actinacidiphila yeochonensis]|uniref:M48 family metallopeptidase n=1 Tax=Actinacidiphila yeochonensis TaxID=89050 RepID=UPI0005656F80|nr:M48 family metallopeptidase [Actinacidiphila yeochonensis]
MSLPLRALRALVLLAGFYLMGVVLLAVLGTVDWLLLAGLFSGRHSDRYGYCTGIVLIASLTLAVPVVRGMAVSLTAGRRATTPPGLVVTEHEQPELWLLVRQSALDAGTEGPRQLVLTGEVNASVSEHSRLLGLLPGPRTLGIGVPLLAGLTEPRLRAVLAHEFGHFSHHDTRLTAVTVRAYTVMRTTVEAFRAGAADLALTRLGRIQAVVGNLYAGYGRYVLRASESVARQQEFAADRVAAERVGRDVTAGALRRLPLLDAAHTWYTDTWAGLGAPVGALPPAGEVVGGFRRMLDARGEQGLVALAAGVRPPRPHPYDSHPPIPERVAAVEALAEAGPVDSPGAPAALSLLRGEAAVMVALEPHVLSQGSPGLPRMPWPELVLARAVADAETESAPLRGAMERLRRSAARDTRRDAAGTPAAAAAAEGPRSSEAEPTPPEAVGDELLAVLAAIDGGLLWTAVADRMPRPPQASRLTGASARNVLRPALWNALAGLILLRLVDAGLARPDTDWTGTPGVTLPEAWEKGMDEAVDAALADEPDTSALRALL